MGGAADLLGFSNARMATSPLTSERKRRRRERKAVWEKVKVRVRTLIQESIDGPQAAAGQEASSDSSSSDTSVSVGRVERGLVFDSESDYVGVFSAKKASRLASQSASR